MGWRVVDLFCGRNRPCLPANRIAPWLLNKQRPTISADQKWDRNSSSVSREQRRQLPVNHWIKLSAPIKLLFAFSKPSTGESVRKEMAALVPSSNVNVWT